MVEYTKRIRPEIPEPDYDDPKELYAFFGLAAYCAQLVEQGLTNLLVGLAIVKKHKPTWGGVSFLYDGADKKTLGRLLRDIGKLIPFKEGLEEELQEVLEKRNYLMHRFFVEHNENLLRKQGRRKMIDELRGIIVAFQAVDPRVDELWLSIWSKYGITEERIERELADLQRVISREV